MVSRMTTIRPVHALLAGSALALCACESTTPDAPPPPPPRPVQLDLQRLVHELADGGLLGHRLGEPPSAAPPGELHGVRVRAAAALPDGVISPGVQPLACFETDDVLVKAVKVFADETGRVELLGLTSLEGPGEPGELAFLSPTAALYRLHTGSRGAVYWARRSEAARPSRRYDDAYRPGREAFVTFAGPPPARHFPGAEPLAAWLERLDGPPLEAARVALSWVHAPVRAAHPALDAWLDRRGGEVFSALLAAGEHEAATRLLAYWDARRFKPTYADRGKHDAERLRQLIKAADVGAYARYKALRGSSFEGIDLGAIEGGDTPGILLRFWSHVLALEETLEKKEWPLAELRYMFKWLEVGIPQGWGGGREIHLSPDHAERRDQVVRAVARLLHAAVGDAAYPDKLAEALAGTTRFEGRRRQELFFDSLGEATQVDALALRRQQLRDELERSWPDEAGRGPAVANYLERVAGSFTDPAEREADRRAVLTRLAASPAAYEALVISVRREPRTEDPDLLDWLPAASRGPIVERLRAQAAREERIVAIERDLKHLIDFEHRPRELGVWSFWGRATVRDGRDAPRFEAAERGAAALREYVEALEAASVNPRTRWFADQAKERAYRAYSRHYGGEAFALFVALPLSHQKDALRLAIETLAPEAFADAWIAFEAGYAEAPAPAVGGSPYAAARAFCALARRYRDEPQRAGNRVIALLQARTLRQHAAAYLERHGEEAYVACLLPLAMHEVDDVELVNEWCNHGVVRRGMIDDYLRRGTIHFVTTAGEFSALTLEGPAELTRYGDLFSLRPRGGADIAGQYRYSAVIRAGGRDLHAKGVVTVAAASTPLLHRVVRQELTAAR